MLAIDRDVPPSPDEKKTELFCKRFEATVSRRYPSRS